MTIHPTPGIEYAEDDCRLDPLVLPCETCGGEAYYVIDNKPSCGEHEVAERSDA